MKCPNPSCGYEHVPEGKSFCPKCGQKVSAPDTEVNVTQHMNTIHDGEVVAFEAKEIKGSVKVVVNAPATPAQPQPQPPPLSDSSLRREPEKEYLDFELRIEQKQQCYEAVVLRSPGGEASHIFQLPFSDMELENFVLKLSRRPPGLRGINSPQMKMVREFGGKLFEEVFAKDVYSCFVSSRNEAKRRKMGLRLKLRLEAPELINIPWEYLYDAKRGRFLSAFQFTPIVRYIDLPEPIEPLSVEPPLSVLIMAASPKDYPSLLVANEEEKLKTALQGLLDQKMVTMTWVEKANLDALRRCLLRGQYHIFHYIGHGGFDDHREGYLVLEDQQHLGRPVSGERLAMILGDAPTLRLVILNACEGARTSRDDPFAGTATTLVRTASVPAVVAMQFAISDKAAITFASGFYDALAAGRPVDAAVAQARQAILASDNDVEWGTPVLYMRSPEGRIFDVAAMPPQMKGEKKPGGAEPARLYAMANEAARVRDWPKTIALFEAILRSAPGYRDAEARLAQAQEALAAEQAARERASQLARLYEEAWRHWQAQRWTEAVAGFEAVLAVDPHYSDPTRGSAATLLDQAQESKLAEPYAQPAARPPKPTTQPEVIKPLGRPRDLPR